MAAVSLVSINIERSKHLDTLIPFLQKQRPDVATFQECMDFDIPLFEDTLGMKCFFTPLNIASRPDEREGKEGCAIFAKEFLSTGSEYYAGEYEPIPVHTEDKHASIGRIAKAVTHVELEKEGKHFVFATTHFTWTPDGEVDDAQRRDLKLLLAVLKKMPEFILTGDFNAPRGRATWNTLAETYKDNIPQHYISSIDPSHRAGELPYVVDGIFSTPGYEVRDVQLHSGVSDHKAVTAIVRKS